MPRCSLPKEILWEMQAANVLQFHEIVAGNLAGNQSVEVTAEMAAWCRTDIDRQQNDQAKAKALRATAEAIEAALKSN